MATLKPIKVAAAAYLGGFRGKEIAVAVAVAKGESSYDTTTCTSQYCGLWQIGTTVNASHIHGDWKNPIVNARAAYELVQSRGWCGGKASNGHCQNFEAYGLNNGGMSWTSKLAEGNKAYAELTAQMQAGKDPGKDILNAGPGASDFLKALNPFDSTNPVTGGISNPVSSVADAASSAISLANKTASWVSNPQSWVRVLWVVGGGVLFIAGIGIAFEHAGGDAAKQVIQLVLPTGKIGKAVSAVSKGVK